MGIEPTTVTFTVMVQHTVVPLRQDCFKLTIRYFILKFRLLRNVAYWQKPTRDFLYSS